MNLDEAKKRIDELEAALQTARAEAAKYKDDTNALMNELYPSVPLTEEEAERLMADTSGRPIMDIIEEFERAASR